MRSFKNFMLIKEEENTNNKDWRKSYIQLEKGFIPPSKMKPVIDAFLASGEIKLTNDVSKAPTMPKKSLFLVGGPVRDFLMNKPIKDFDLATNATPEQIAHILSNAGFKMAGDRSGKNGKPLNLTFKPEEAQSGEKKYWFIKGRDASQDGKAFVISAVVDGEEFEIATFRKDAKVTDGAAEVDFVDNPHDDASRRDLTVNSLYIELTKSNGENSKLFDPTGKGWHDVKNNVVRTVGKPEDRFQEDKLRVLRAIRFHSRFGTTDQMDPEIEKALPKFKHLEGVALERIRDEFLKGLVHPDVDSRRYLSIYKRTGLLSKVFPDVSFESTAGVPVEFTDKKDKLLALAWLLQHNSLEKINNVLSPLRKYGEEEKATGWTTQEKRAILFLLKLKEFSPEQLPNFMKMREGTGLSNQQIRDWVDMFKIKGTAKNSRPWWAKQVNAFSDYQKSINWQSAVDAGHHKCSNCKGQGCVNCRFTGEVSPEERGNVISKLEIDNFKNKLK